MSIPVARTDKALSDLTEAEQHEALLEVFGEHVFWARNSVLGSIEGLITAKDKRERLARAHREPFDRAANLGDDERQIALRLLEKGIDSFAKELLRIIGNEGLDLRINDREAVRYRLDAELCSADSGDVRTTQTISRGGKRFLPECWGRWLNKFRRR